MEEFGWILFIAVFWILSSLGEFRKAQKKKQRREDGGEATKRRPRRVERRPGSRRPGEARKTGPQAGRRELARGVDEAARRADDALRRWESRQRATPSEAAAPSPADEGRAITASRASRAEVSDERREAYTAIADMLAGHPPEPEAPQPIGIVERPSPPARPREGGGALPSPRPTFASRRATAPARPTSGVSARERLSRLGPLRSAVVWSELLGPPLALREDDPLRR